MKKRAIGTAAVLAFAASAVTDCCRAQAVTLYVSTRGNDSWTGTSSEPADTGSVGPFATIERARGEIRRMKQEEGLPKQGVTVEILGGKYELARPIELTAEDAGTATSPVSYRARSGDEVRISGGRAITDWTPVTDPAVLDRLDPAARGKVFHAKLKALGITEYGDLLHDAEWRIQWRHHKDDNQAEATRGDAAAAQSFVGQGGAEIEPRLELFCNGEPMQLSRWPNDGFTRVDKALGETKFEVRGLAGRREGIFSCVDDRPGRWTDEKDGMVRGYWYRDWAVQTHRIESIDPEKRIIKVARPYHNYDGYRDGMWFFGLNLLCELDSEGEWYLDRDSGILYFWPPAPLEDSQVEVSVSNGLFELTNTAFVTLRGLLLESTRGTAIRITDSDNCRVIGCSIRNTTNYAVTILDGKDCAVIGCDITGTGGGGVFMAGGDRQKLVSGGHFVENCHIHHFARWDRMYRPGILMTGAGLRASHNLIHHGPHSGIVYGGPLHRFDHNEIHNVCQESHDCGAIYGGRSWCMRGAVFEHNYLHHLWGKDGGPCNGIYLDDANSGATVRGNVFYCALRPVFVGGGRDILVENNIFIDCAQAFHMDARYAPGNWAAQYGDPRLDDARKTGVLNGIRFMEPPYSERFPELARMLDEDPSFPKGNILRRNIFWRGDAANLRRLNWENPPESKAWRQEEWWYHIQRSVYDLLVIEDNLVDVDPGFVDAEAGDFRLRDDSPAWGIGFERIPFEKIGLYRDELRASWPVEHPVTPLPEQRSE